MATEGGIIRKDGPGERFLIWRIDADENPIPEHPKITVALGDAAARFPAEGTGVALEIKLRVIRDCFGGEAGYRIVLCSEFIAGEPPEGFEAD